MTEVNFSKLQNIHRVKIMWVESLNALTPATINSKGRFVARSMGMEKHNLPGIT